ncbi:Flap endonuclease 1 [Pacmanvirus A23]|uniref:Flap endonuclease 1 n=1 Tax=Pacmanvirus A23 TaxID=1932881 RepID=UPI000A091F13|nr:Flap endonuclease 1 [Pacmanvirus A23]SIP85851.1 Flap endonuclease 1 [Pacmanvirus A23]
MGVKNLNKLIKECAPKAIESIDNIKKFEQWRIGVDASLVIYQMCSVGTKYNIKNKQGKFIHHIQGIFFRTVKMIISGIHPVYVFDSKPPELKSEVIAKRRELRDAGTATRIPREVFLEVRKLLELMGVKCIDAGSEAEAEIAALTTDDILDAADTLDTDCLAFGVRYMIQGLDTPGKKITLIDRKKLLEELKLTQEQFIDLCILLGTDYNTGLFGPKRALAMIKKHHSIEKILEKEEITPENFNFKESRREFLHHKVSGIKFDPEVKQLKANDISKLRDFLINVHGLEESRISKTLNNLAAFYDIV